MVNIAYVVCTLCSRFKALLLLMAVLGYSVRYQQLQVLLYAGIGLVQYVYKYTLWLFFGIRQIDFDIELLLITDYQIIGQLGMEYVRNFKERERHHTIGLALMIYNSIVIEQYTGALYKKILAKVSTRRSQLNFAVLAVMSLVYIEAYRYIINYHYSDSILLVKYVYLQLYLNLLVIVQCVLIELLQSMEQLSSVNNFLIPLIKIAKLLVNVFIVLYKKLSLSTIASLNPLAAIAYASYYYQHIRKEVMNLCLLVNLY
jgi:hypothetical protein